MEPERQEFKGHRIELRKREDEREEAMPELFIDDRRVGYDRLPDGSYALYEYAYDWQDNLMDLARTFIDYRDRADEVRREAGPDE